MRSDIGVIAGQLRDAALVHDAFDVIADFSYPLPVIVVSRILGVPEEDYGRLKDWSGQLTGALDSGEAGELAGGIRASEELLAYMARSEEHTSELQSLMRISYAVFCLKKKNKKIKLLNVSQNRKT